MIRYTRLFRRLPAAAVLLLCAVKLLISPASAQTVYTWIDNGNVGNWSDPSRLYSTGAPGVPSGTHDTAIILSGNITVDTYFTFYGVMDWSGGTLAGDTFTIGSGGVLNISNNVIVGCPILNNGTVNWAGGNIFYDSSDYFTTAGPIVNLGQWNIECSGATLSANNYTSPNVYFENGSGGVLLKTNSPGTTTFYVAFTNIAWVTNLSGNITVENGGFPGGQFYAATNTVIDFDGGSYPMVSAAPVATGPGLVEFTGNATVSFTTGMTGVLNLGGGTVSSTLAIAPGSTLNLTGSVSFDGALTNFGTVNWLAGNIYLQTCSYPSAGPLVNIGQWNIQSGLNALSAGCGATNAWFTNAGIVLKSNAPGTTTYFSMPFTNSSSATVQVDSGTISLENGGILNGSFVAEASAAIDFDGGSFPLVGAAPAASGAGIVQFTGNGAVSFTQPMTGVLNFAGGILTQSLTVSPGATLNINGIGVTLTNASALTNQGTVNWLNGYLYMASCTAGPIVNQSGATWNIQSGLNVSCSCPLGPNAFFTNSGTVHKSAVANNTYFLIAFDNSGTLQADIGAILLDQGGTLGGSFVAEPGAAIDFDGGSFALAGAAPAASGGGVVQFSGTAGIAFSAPMTGVLNLAGGVITAPLTITSNSTANITGNVTLDSTFTNKGTVNWSNGVLFLDTVNFPQAGPIVNLPGAVWNLKCNENISDNNLAATNAFFTNAGTVLKTNSTGFTVFYVPFNNSSTVQTATGSISLEQGGDLDGSFVTSVGTSIYFDGGSFPRVSAAPAFTGPGMVQFSGTSMVTYSQPMTGGMIISGGTFAGPLTISASGTVNIMGSVSLDGALTNSGTLNWLAGNIFLQTCQFPLAGPIVNLGQWNIQCDATNLSCVPGAVNAWFTNNGTVHKSVTAGTTLVTIPFSNSGTLQADTGTIELLDGGAVAGQFITGAGATIEFNGGSFFLSNNAPASSGLGRVLFGGGADVNLTGPVTGVMNLTGGTVGGPLTIASGGILNITGSVTLLGALTNSGTVNWLAGNVYLDTCTSNLAGPLVNLGQWNIGCDATNLSCFQGAVNSYFINQGTVLKTNTTGITLIEITFNNSGTLQANAGTIGLTSGGALGGLFVAETNAASDFEAGNFTLNGAAPAASGTGVVQFTGTPAFITCVGPMTGVLNCAGATFAGPLTIAGGSTLNISDSVAVLGALTNSGTVNLLAGNVYLNTCVSNLAGPVVNLGQWNIKCDSTNLACQIGPNAFFTNQGTVLKTNASGINLFEIPFNNSGALKDQTGTIQFLNGGVLGGTFVTGSGTGIGFNGGAFSLPGNALASSGPGQVQFAGTAGVTFSQSMIGILNFAGGTIAGPLTIASGGILNITGSVAVDAALTNSGTVNWLAGYLYLDTCVSNLAGPIVNLGQWNIECDSTNLSCQVGPNAYFINQGTVLKTNTSGTTLIAIPFNNSGTLRAASGTIQLTNGGALGGLFATVPGTAVDFVGGSFSLPGNALLTNGSGQVQFGGTAGVSFALPVTNVLNFAGGTIAGPLAIASTGTLNILDSVALLGALTNYGTVNWLSGNIYLNTCISNLAGPVVNLGQWNIECDMTNLSCSAGDNAFFTNGGNVLKTNSTGTTYFSIPFNNSGTLKAQTGNMELMGGGVLGGQFVANTNMAIDFENGNFTLNGAAPAASGAGLVQFTGFNANITCIGPMSGVLNCYLASIVAPLTIAANGTFNILGTGVAIDSPFTNSGTVNWLGTNVYLGALGAGPLVNLPGGVWNIQSGRMLSSGYPSDAGAYFTNAGTVLVTNNSVTANISIPFINAGTVIADTGTLLFNSGYGQSSTANLIFSLGGPVAGIDYSQFQFTYAPVFAGALSIGTRNGYQPGVGTAFTVLDYPSFTGAFSSTNVDLGGGLVLQPQFNPTNLVLTAAAVTAPTLSISISGASVTVQWTPGFSTWVLQSATNLSNPNWTTLSFTGNSTVVPVQPKQQQYFRMHN